MAVLVTVSTDSPSLELGDGAILAQSLQGSSTSWGSSGTKGFFTDFV